MSYSFCESIPAAEYAEEENSPPGLFLIKLWKQQILYLNLRKFSLNRISNLL